jgi:hypothetical protein
VNATSKITEYLIKCGLMFMQKIAKEPIIDRIIGSLAKPCVEKLV